MDSFIIRGPSKLSGAVRISGAKNAMLPQMAATILTGGKCVLENVPDLRDTRTMMKVLETLGIPSQLDSGVLTADASEVTSFEAPYDLVRTMRASIYALGPLLARFGKARVSMPGGCAWGPRPIEQHLKGMMTLGAKLKIDHGYIDARADRLKGARVVLAMPSVGATVNIMLAASLADGETVIENAAREPEITGLANTLREAGVDIEGDGTSTVHVQGREAVEPFTHRIIPDRIEAGTYAAAAVITGGDITIENCLPGHMSAVIEKIEACGAEVTLTEDTMRVKGPKKISPVNIDTGYYPSFPTDMQAQMMAVLCRADGASTVVEHVYPDRFTHVPELRRFGAKVTLDGSVAVVMGVDYLEGAPVMATDIRASSALLLAAMVAEGESKILRIYHIERGYEDIEGKLRALGADIERVAD
jgi:UDP-N-acetylglucosamine 1-carboxyvinyltransferase